MIVNTDIGLAARALGEVLGELNYRNLDDEPAFAGRNTTTEFLARVVFDRVAERLRAGELGANAVGLGLLSKRFPERHTTRTFEIPACGALLATERTADTTRFFDES